MGEGGVMAPRIGQLYHVFVREQDAAEINTASSGSTVDFSGGASPPLFNTRCFVTGDATEAAVVRMTGWRQTDDMVARSEATLDTLGFARNNPTATGKWCAYYPESEFTLAQALADTTQRKGVGPLEIKAEDPPS